MILDGLIDCADSECCLHEQWLVIFVWKEKFKFSLVAYFATRWRYSIEEFFV